MQARARSGRSRSRVRSAARSRSLAIATTLAVGSPFAVSTSLAPRVATAAPAAADPAATPAAKQDKRRFLRCTQIDDEDRCVRPGPARALLLGLGALAGGAAAALLFAVGDRHAPGDPAVLLVGTGALAGAGALVGFITAWAGGEGAPLADRVRPATADLSYTYGGVVALDERSGHGLSLGIAPTLRVGDGQSRIRLIGHFGGWLLERQQVDPRPQFTEPIPDQAGTAPIALRQRRMSGGIGLDFAVALPYPIGRLSALLGPAELRWRPTFEFRREPYRLGQEDRVVERTMLLPLTAGARWHLSFRQRFTFYFGPRFDLVAYSEPGSNDLQRGRPQLGPLYAEAWYEIDVPLTSGPRRDAKPRRVDANSQIVLGYVHSRFDGLGFNFGPVIGFLGPIHVGWVARLRPRGAKVAVQTGANVRIGNGFAATVGVGLVTPDLYASRRARR